MVKLFKERENNLKNRAISVKEMINILCPIKKKLQKYFINRLKLIKSIHMDPRSYVNEGSMYVYI